MKIENVIVAEAGATDGRGVVSLIGLSQNVTTAPELPMQVKRTVFVYAVDENGDIEPGDTVSVRLALSEPDGEVLQASSNDATVGPKKWEHLPGSIQFAADMIFVAHTYGTYTFTCEISHKKFGKVHKSTPLYVIQDDG